jgi:hypothetical protein
MGMWKATQTDYDELKLAVDDAIYDLESLVALLDVDCIPVESLAWRVKQVIRRLKDD